MRPAATLFAVLCVALAAGCGGGSDGGGNGASPTRASYIAAGDAVCRRTNAGIAATNARIAQINRTATDAGQALSDAAPLLSETAKAQGASVTEFHDLSPPPGDAAEVDAIVAGIEEQVALVGQVADAAAAGDVARIQSLGASLRSTRDRVRGLLQDYGFKECGRTDG